MSGSRASKSRFEFPFKPPISFRSALEDTEDLIYRKHSHQAIVRYHCFGPTLSCTIISTKRTRCFCGAVSDTHLRCSGRQKASFFSQITIPVIAMRPLSWPAYYRPYSLRLQRPVVNGD